MKTKTPTRKTIPKKPVRKTRSGADSYETPRTEPSDAAKTLVVIMAVLVVACMVGVFAIFNGGFKGIWYKVKPLPNFETGQVYEARDTYRGQMASINGKLEDLTEKQYNFPYYDTCRRSVNNLFATSDYQASCERSVARMYFSHKPICQLYDEAKNIDFNVKTSIPDRVCEQARGLRGDEVLDKHDADASITVIVATKEAAAELLRGNYFGLYSLTAKCEITLFCQYYEGDVADWASRLPAEDYETVVLLNAHKTYYKQ